MNRPTILQVGGVLYWVLHTRNPDTMVLKDADSDPTVAVRKNGASVADSVTVTKRAATTGIYDCSYNPAAEVEGDSFTLEETAVVTGTTTGSATYKASWTARVVAVERGTDGALTTLGTNAPSDWFNAASISADAGAEIAALVETYIVNEGDATAVMQAIADKIAADWVAGDASPLAVASAVWANATRTLSAFAFTPTPSNAADTTAILADTNELQTDWVNGGRLDLILDIVAADTTTDIPALIAAEAVKTAAIKDRVSYCLTVLVGACADPGTAAETYAFAIGGETFTADYTGLDATGTRTLTTLSKV